MHFLNVKGGLTLEGPQSHICGFDFVQS